MRHRERQILCEDPTGKRYRVEILVNTHLTSTPHGTCKVDGPEECWLDAGDSYRPVNAFEPFEVFTFVDQGRIVTLRRVRGRGRLPSFLQKPSG